MVLGLALVFLMAAAGCAKDTDNTKEPSGTGNKKEEEPLYSVSINGTEIRVGETKVQALLNDGLDVTWSEMTEDMQIEHYVVDPDMELDENSYYTGGTVWVTDECFAHVAIVTDEERVKLGDAVIASMEFHFSYADDKEVLSGLTFNGVPVTEMTREKAGEVFPDFRGDDAMWFSSGLKDYKYSMGFNSQTGEMISLSVERQYDVDWNS